MPVLEHSVTRKSSNSKLIITRHILEYSITHNSQLIISQYVYRTFQNISGCLKSYDLLLTYTYVHTYIHLTTYLLPATYVIAITVYC